MQIYVVKSGDTLYRIARRFGTPMEELIYVNQLQAPGVLSVGQAMLIPQPKLHIVQKGESLYSIAKQHNLSLRAVIDANPQLKDPDKLAVGQAVILPVDNVGTRQVVVNGYFSNVSERTLAESLPNLTFLSAFSYRVEADGTLTKDFAVDLDAAAPAQRLMCVTNLKQKGGFSSDLAHRLLTDQSVQDRVVDSILETLAQESFAGVNLDLEYVYPEDRAAYNQFLSRLADALHRRDRLLVTALAPKLSDEQTGLLYEAHDYAFHGQVADYTVLMTYEWGYTYGPPMAVAPIDMVEKVLRYAVSEIPSEKILMGIPNYGYDWTLPYREGTAARVLSNVQAVTLAGEAGAEIRFDEAAKVPFYRYAVNGTAHEVWFEDARSLQAKLDLVEAFDLAGVSFWNLNRLFRTNFAVLNSMYRVVASGCG